MAKMYGRFRRNSIINSMPKAHAYLPRASQTQLKRAFLPSLTLVCRRLALARRQLLIEPAAWRCLHFAPGTPARGLQCGGAPPPPAAVAGWWAVWLQGGQGWIAETHESSSSRRKEVKPHAISSFHHDTNEERVESSSLKNLSARGPPAAHGPCMTACMSGRGRDSSHPTKAKLRMTDRRAHSPRPQSSIDH